MNHENEPESDPGAQRPMPNAPLNRFAQGCLGFFGFHVYFFILCAVELFFLLSVRRAALEKIALPVAIGWGVAGLYLGWIITRRKQWWPFFPVGILLGLARISGNRNERIARPFTPL